MTISKKSYSFDITVNDVTFHIWSRKNSSPDEIAVDTMAHMHYHSEFHYVYEGVEKIVISDTGKMYEIRKNEMAVIPSNIYHTVTSDSKLSRECFFLDIEYCATESLNKHSDYYLFGHILSKIKDVTVINDDFISLILDNFRKLNNYNMSSLDLRRGFLLINAITKFLESEYISTSNAVIKKSKLKLNAFLHNRKRIIEEFISTYYMESKSLSELAKTLSLSERQVHNVIKNIFGTDYKTLVLKQRINTANVLIKTTNMTLEEVSRRVGYNSYSGFYMAYVRLMGVSPESLRK